MVVQSYEALQQIADDLPADSDPGLLARCGEFFLQHGLYDKAVRMLMQSKQYSRALDMCVDQEVAISEVSPGGAVHACVSDVYYYPQICWSLLLRPLLSS